MSKWIHFNGTLVDANTNLVTAANRGLRYGDGLFETIKLIDRQMALANYHFERLFNGLQLLQIPVPSSLTADYLADCVLQLCKKNEVSQAARVRLNIFRGKGNLFSVEEPALNIIIEAEQLLQQYGQWNEKGLTTGIYRVAKKSCDSFANLKSNNFIPYVMGALHAKQQQLDDSFILNAYNRVCDATIANVFWIKDGVIATPALSEGCVAGVMRRYLLDKLQHTGYNIQEKPLSMEELQQADELFLTNALYGIRRVEQCEGKQYSSETTTELYNRFIKKQ